MTDKELRGKFLGRKLTFIDVWSGEDAFVGLITEGEWGMYVTVCEVLDKSYKKYEDFFGVRFEPNYITIKDHGEDIAAWSEK